MFAVATVNSTVFIEFYLYLHDLCVFVCVLLYVFVCFMCIWAKCLK